MSEHDYILTAYAFAGICLACLAALTGLAARRTSQKLRRLQSDSEDA